MAKLRRTHAVVAPTGIAAELVGGTTIHSMFKLGAHDYFPDNVVDKYQQYQRIVEYVSTLIIDEVSMLRADIFDAIEKLCRKARNNTEPFGGIQIILIGDLYQLPPVYKNNEKATDYLMRQYKLSTPFFFDAKCYEKGKFHFLELTENHRQKSDNEFFENLRNISQGKLIAQKGGSVLDYFNAKVEEPNDEVSIVTAKKSDAQHINKQRLERLPSAKKTFIAKATGPYYEGEKRQDRINESHVPEILELKTGARVMICKNDQNLRYVNGSMGRIVSFGMDSISVMLDNSTKVELDKARWDVQEYTITSNNQLELKTIGTFEQYPLKLAYAITIHKSQGQTWDRVHIDLGTGAFASGQVYVALSRVKSIEGVQLRKALTEADIKVNQRVRSFIQNKGVVTSNTGLNRENNVIQIQVGQHKHVSKIYNDNAARWTIDNTELGTDLYLQAGRPEQNETVYIFKIKGGTYTRINFVPNNQARFGGVNITNPDKRDIAIDLGTFKELYKMQNPNQRLRPGRVVEPVDFSRHLWLTINTRTNEVIPNSDYKE